MKIKITKDRILGLLAVPALVLSMAGVMTAVPAYAETDLSVGGGASSAKGNDQSTCLFGNEDGCDGETPIFRTITNVLLFIIGAVSVIMLIIGGIRYTVSQGDSTQVTSAKNTILYAVVGLVVAILGYALVNFVISSFVSND